MTIFLRLAASDEKALLRGVLNDYLTELTQYGEVDLDYPYFEAYWSDGDRWPYLIEYDGQFAGFALVNRWSPSQRGTDFAIAEFYILPGFRKSGIGRQAFLTLLQKHRGLWELSIFSRNLAAKEFWQHAITTAGVTGIECITLEDYVVYRFSTPTQ
jgi:predicted acetyltransferase